MSTAARPEPSVSCTASRVTLRDLEANVLTWEPPPGGAYRDDTVVLLHGWADTAESFDLVTTRIALAGYRVIAPDLRGFGDSAPIGAGGYYHFPDYVADVTELLDLLATERVSLIGHSMGGTIAAQVAGIHRDRVRRLALLEGLGPTTAPLESVPDRYRKWLEDLRTHAARPRHRSFSSLAEVIERLAISHPDVPREVLASRAPLLTRPADGGRLVWKYDPLHRTTSPMPFLLELFGPMLRQITCPTLFVSGGPAGYHPNNEAERLAQIPNVRTMELKDAGHMMHWTAPTALADAILAFLA